MTTAFVSKRELQKLRRRPSRAALTVASKTQKALSIDFIRSILITIYGSSPIVDGLVEVYFKNKEEEQKRILERLK